MDCLHSPRSQETEEEEEASVDQGRTGDMGDREKAGDHLGS